VTWDLPSPYIHARAAQERDIDGYGHVNNAVYITWLDDCAWAHSSALGLAAGDCRALDRGMAVWRTQVNYLLPVLAGEEVEVGTWIVFNDQRLRIDRRFQIRRKGDSQTVLRALIHYVCIELSSGRARRMPPQFPAAYAVRADVRAAIDAETAPFQPGVEIR